jgi:hypothetical protein
MKARPCAGAQTPDRRGPLSPVTAGADAHVDSLTPAAAEAGTAAAHPGAAAGTLSLPRPATEPRASSLNDVLI